MAARGGVSRRAFIGASGAALSLGVLPRVARAAGPVPGLLTADVAVVGAGLAGLAAADALAARGVSVLVLEASDRVGGRVLDMPIEGGAVAPLGAAWVHPSQRRVQDLAARAGLRLRTVKRRAGADGLPAGVIPALRWLDAMAEHVDTAAWSGGQAARRDTVNLAAWFADQAIDPAAGAHLSRLAEAVWGVPPAEVSLLQALADVAAAGSAAALAELAIAPSRFVEGGAGRLVAHLASGLGPRVLLSQPVQRIEHHPGGVRVVAGIVTVEAERAVVAVPPAVAAGIDFAPAILAQRMLAQRLPMGSAATVACTYPGPLRTRRGAPGVFESSALLDAVTVTPAGSRTWLARGEIRGSRARRWAALPDEERRSAVLDDLAARFASPARRPSSYVEHDWQAHPWSAGGWAGVAPPGVLSGFGAALRQPVGPVHFAGAETASVWAGRLEGALESAERVAAEVLTAMRSEGAA